MTTTQSLSARQQAVEACRRGQMVKQTFASIRHLLDGDDFMKATNGSSEDDDWPLSSKQTSIPEDPFPEHDEEEEEDDGFGNSRHFSGVSFDDQDEKPFDFDSQHHQQAYRMVPTSGHDNNNAAASPNRRRRRASATKENEENDDVNFFDEEADDVLNFEEPEFSPSNETGDNDVNFDAASSVFESDAPSLFEESSAAASAEPLFNSSFEVINPVAGSSSGLKVQASQAVTNTSKTSIEEFLSPRRKQSPARKNEHIGGVAFPTSPLASKALGFDKSPSRKSQNSSESGSRNSGSRNSGKPRKPQKTRDPSRPKSSQHGTKPRAKKKPTASPVPVKGTNKAELGVLAALASELSKTRSGEATDVSEMQLTDLLVDKVRELQKSTKKEQSTRGKRTTDSTPTTLRRKPPESPSRRKSFEDDSEILRRKKERRPDSPTKKSRSSSTTKDRSSGRNGAQRKSSSSSGTDRSGSADGSGSADRERPSREKTSSSSATDRSGSADRERPPREKTQRAARSVVISSSDPDKRLRSPKKPRGRPKQTLVDTSDQQVLDVLAKLIQKELSAADE